MEVTQGPSAESDKGLADLPPDLKLLYDTLNIRLSSIENKIDPNVATRVEHVETQQRKTEARLTKVKIENEELRQRLVSIEDKLLENSVVINGISEEKYEDPGPRRTKLNIELARILSGNTDEEKLEKADSLQIESTERVGKFNATKGHPIAIKFARKCNAEMVLERKQKLRKGIYVDMDFQMVNLFRFLARRSAINP